MLLALYAIYFLIDLIVFPQTDPLAYLVGLIIPALGIILSDAKIFMGFTHLISFVSNVRKRK
jgi:hypothetical protein